MVPFEFSGPDYVHIPLIRKQGHLDVELNETGRRQAAAVSCIFLCFSSFYIQTKVG